MNLKQGTSTYTHSLLNFKLGIRDMLPLSLAVIPWAVMAGALAINAGLSIEQAMGMSIFVFAGAAQIMSLSMLMAGASSLSILVIVFFMTTQHFIYALTLKKHIKQMSLCRRLSLGFLLTDELYAVSVLYPNRTYAYLFGAGLSFYLFWITFSFVGICFSLSLNSLATLHLDYSIVAIFLVMAILLIKNIYAMIAVIVSGTLAVLLKSMNIQFGIVISSLAGMALAAVLEQRGK